MKKEHFEILLEEMNGKFDLVLDGHSVLANKIENVRDELKQDINQCNFKIEALNDKIDSVAAELKAHRADTEMHHGMYRVKERP